MFGGGVASCVGYGDRAAWRPRSGLQCGFLAADGRECLTNVYTLERNPEQLLFSPGEQPSLPEVDDLKQLVPLRRSQ